MPIQDTFKTRDAGLTSPLSNMFNVVPDDQTDLIHVTRALYVGAGGSLSITTAGGQTVTIPEIAPGWHPLRVCRVHATGTTATGIVGGW
ncbi:hypothetical protein [Jannaschia sp. LMIT008]|uniref:spike base protein, RCAP_Rcc01079 family n=1 Tax=Jannaschia maritima TaxID=3032585 RepID=UPI002812568F|nr:hypothetical protein [Jannaschia sp. LMIT008]